MTTVLREGGGGVDLLAQAGDRKFTGMRDDIRRGFHDFLRVNFEQTRLLSREQAEEQRRYVEEKLRDGARDDLQRLWEDYASPRARSRLQENARITEEAQRRLERAKEQRVISQDSYEEWLQWLRDDRRDSTEKKGSIVTILTAYLKEREDLHRDRAALLADVRLGAVTDPAWEARVRFLREDTLYFTDLTATQRRNLIDGLRGYLAALDRRGEGMGPLFALAQRTLLAATKLPQPALHRDKVGRWLSRIFESGASAEEIRQCIEGSGSGTLSQLIDTWRAIAVEYWRERSHPVFQGMRTEFVRTGVFLRMHYDEADDSGMGRVPYVAMIRREQERARELRARAASLIAKEGVGLDQEDRERWLKDFVFNGRHSLDEIAQKLDVGIEPGEGTEGGKGRHQEAKEGEAASTLRQLRALVANAPVAFQSFYARLLTQGNEYVHAYRWIWYNRIWCRDRKHLYDEREYTCLEQAERETYLRHELGVQRQGRQVVSDTIKGKTARTPYIEACDYAPTNIFTDFSDTSSVETLWTWLRNNRRNGRVLYWANLMPCFGDQILSDAAHREELDRLTDMRRLSRDLERQGMMFSLVGPAPSLN